MAALLEPIAHNQQMVVICGIPWTQHYAKDNCSMSAFTWWRHQLKTFSVLLVLCEGKPPVTAGFPSVTRFFRNRQGKNIPGDAVVILGIERTLVAENLSSTEINQYAQRVVTFVMYRRDSVNQKGFLPRTMTLQRGVGIVWISLRSTDAKYVLQRTSSW